jgi:glucose/mannose-6-phosphate isomerase
MRDAILNLNRQFAFKPKIENASKLKKRKKFLICGVGGSGLPGPLLKMWNPELDVVVWEDYGLPPIKDLKERLVIVNSYSGNTEEAIDSYRQAKRKKLPHVVISSGGRLLEFARRDKVPFVQIPSTGIQPRSALGFVLRGFMKVVGDEKGLRESAKLVKKLNPSSLEAAGKKLATELQGSIPVVYTSRANSAIAYNWKIKFNETSKIPAFMNVLPEVNHNEMNGFDVIPSTRLLSKQIRFVFLDDPADNRRTRLRMKITADLYRKRGFKVSEKFIDGDGVFAKMFHSLALADWTAFHLAMHYGTEAEKVPMVEDFKRRLAQHD